MISSNTQLLLVCSNCETKSAIFGVVAERRNCSKRSLAARTKPARDCTSATLDFDSAPARFRPLSAVDRRDQSGGDAEGRLTRRSTLGLSPTPWRPSLSSRTGAARRGTSHLKSASAELMSAFIPDERSLSVLRRIGMTSVVMSSRDRLGVRAVRPRATRFSR